MDYREFIFMVLSLVPFLFLLGNQFAKSPFFILSGVATHTLYSLLPPPIFDLSSCKEILILDVAL